jgi:DNA/RNA-binding domain of Phe-tRNA-synthetase-like protein
MADGGVNMGKFIIAEDFWTVFPDARIGVVVCQSIDNRPNNQEHYAGLLCEAQSEALQYLTHAEFSSNPVIRTWREAFQKFKTKKGARSSIEALLKRVHNGNSINSINPLVDLYNTISLKYGLPCGGEDIDAFIGDLHLTKADGDEHFIALGEEENAPPYPGEIVYKDDAGAVCRCWNWREAKRTMLTADTKNAFLCIELVDGTRSADLSNALDDLAASVHHNLGGKCRMAVLDRHQGEITIR